MTIAALRRLGPILAIALVILVDAIVLAGAAWNRKGEPEAVILMTERELSIAPTWKENSGLWLSLDWNQYEAGPAQHAPRPVWETPERLRALGFHIGVSPEHPDAEVVYSKALPLERFAVLEFEGESWARWLGEQEQEIDALSARIARGEEPPTALEFARKSLEFSRVARSRLSIVDLGRNPDELRRHYADRGRFLITRAVVVLVLTSRWDSDLNRNTDFRLETRVRDLLPNELHVTRALRPVPEAIRDRAAQEHPEAEWYHEGRGGAPRYEVEVRYGRRLEPWIASIRELPEASGRTTSDP